MKDKVFTQELNGESYPNKTTPTTGPTSGVSDSIRRHLFTDSIIGVPLSDKGKDFNRDHYDGTTDPNKHMDVYTAYISMYTSNDAILCRVCSTSLKGGTLSWFTKHWVWHDDWASWCLTWRQAAPADVMWLALMKGFLRKRQGSLDQRDLMLRWLRCFVSQDPWGL